MKSKLLHIAAVLFIFSLFLPQVIMAQSNKKNKINLDSLFSKQVYVSSKGDTLPWRSYESAKSSTEKLPLFIFLHGSGERGTDNRKQLAHLEFLFPSEDSLKVHSALYIIPQCPEEKRWVECDWDAAEHTTPETPSIAMFALYELMDSLLATGRYDSKRIYIIGLSMGGFGVWDMLARTPEKIAAAVPICGGADDAKASVMVSVPIHAFHGDKDDAVKVERTRHIIQNIQKAGGKPLYTEYAGVGHGSWIPAFQEKDLLQWIFTQVKQ